MSDLSGHARPVSGPSAHAARPWRRAAVWLSVLGPFFFISYGAASWFAAMSPNVGTIVYAWERHIPFLDWTIIPYWSIDLLYAAALFVCTSRSEVDIVAKRLLTAQVVAVMCFIAFPLSFSFARPESSGLAGALFALLEGFDKPYNQAPSLHIALLVILWAFYPKHLPRRFHKLLHAWFALIGVSVLTTYQHHFIDVPTGVLLGLFCLWLWPDTGSHAFEGRRLTEDRRRLRIAAAYAAGSAMFFCTAFIQRGIALWLVWPAISLFLVAVAYAGLGTAVFQKTAHGHLSPAARWLLGPYLIGAWINSRLWTRNDPEPVHVADGVWLGRFPSSFDLEHCRLTSVIDMTAEFSAPDHNINWHAIPSLDLITPNADNLRQAAQAIEQARRCGPVLVCCALGYSRSAHALALWLAMTGRAEDARVAMAQIAAARPQIAKVKSNHSTVAGPRCI